VQAYHSGLIPYVRAPSRHQGLLHASRSIATRSPTTAAFSATTVDSAFVSIYTIGAFLRRGRPDSTLVRIATAGASMDRGSTSKSSVRSGASSQRQQPPLPTLAGFEFSAEDVASHDGSLSTFCAQRETAGVSDNLAWRDLRDPRRSTCPVI
jgi:hypothetical protein